MKAVRRETTEEGLAGPPRAGRARPGRESGVALVLTVWVLAILALVAGEFLFSSRLRIMAEGHSRSEVQAYGLALAGYQAALGALGEDLRALSRNEEGDLLLHRAGEAEPSPAGIREVALGEGTYTFGIDDEDGKLDINRQGREAIVSLLREAGFELGAERDALADSILDWRDTNREHRLNGAEEEYYRRLEAPYSAKDGPFETKEELLLVKGMKEEYYYGEGKGGGRVVPLGDLVTVYPVAFNADTAPEEVLRALRRAPSGRPGRVSQFFTILSTGRVAGDGVSRTVKAVVRREGQGGRILFRLIYWNDNHSFREKADDVG